MTAIVRIYTEVGLPRGLECGAELQETDFRRNRNWIAFKTQEKRQNVDNDALGQKGRSVFS